jgi:hypothetical protein
VGHAAFVLVAGGLGERLGYKGEMRRAVHWMMHLLGAPLCAINKDQLASHAHAVVCRTPGVHGK